MSKETPKTESKNAPVDRRAAMMIGGVAALTTLAAATDSKASETAGMAQSDVHQAAQVIERARTGIVLTGTITNGRVEFDKGTLEEISKKFAGANTSFVAVNAPFDPMSAAVD